MCGEQFPERGRLLDLGSERSWAFSPAPSVPLLLVGTHTALGHPTISRVRAAGLHVIDTAHDVRAASMDERVQLLASTVQMGLPTQKLTQQTNGSMPRAHLAL